MPPTPRPPLGPRDLAISDLTAVHNDIARDKADLLVRHAQKKNEKAAIAARERFALLSTAGRGEANLAKGAMLIETAERVKRSDVTLPTSRDNEVGLLVTPATAVSRGAPQAAAAATSRSSSRPRSASRRRRPKVAVRDPIMQNPDLAARMTQLRADKEKFQELAESIKERRENKRQVQTSSGSKIRQNKVWASSLTKEALEAEQRARLQEAAGHREKVLEIVNDRDLEMRLYREGLASRDGAVGVPAWRASSATPRPRGDGDSPPAQREKRYKDPPEMRAPAVEAATKEDAVEVEGEVEVGEVEVGGEEDDRGDLITEFPKIDGLEYDVVVAAGPGREEVFGK